jgi:hypothetical protein
MAKTPPNTWLALEQRWIPQNPVFPPIAPLYFGNIPVPPLHGNAINSYPEDP